MNVKVQAYGWDQRDVAYESLLSSVAEALSAMSSGGTIKLRLNLGEALHHFCPLLCNEAMLIWNISVHISGPLPLIP